ALTINRSTVSGEILITNYIHFHRTKICGAVAATFTGDSTMPTPTVTSFVAEKLTVVSEPRQQEQIDDED
ncbi:hypothetical protein LXA26_18170, partial [Erwinia amylovora]|uniref:hypothetical protein n=1 Tax=Erwinia amylovora TaxID=552 RepID=UPI0020BF3A99